MGSILDVADIIKQINGNKELMAQIAIENANRSKMLEAQALERRAKNIDLAA